VSGEGRGRGAQPAAAAGSRWDLLADYASGALDGTPEADRVAARIAADPEWARAHHELAEADARIRDELSGLAGLAAGEAVPADLFDRLDAALAAAGGDTSDEGAVVRSLEEARRRRYRMLSAAAALVVVLAGVGGLVGLANLGSRATNSSTAGGGAPARNPSGSQRPMAPHLDSKAQPSGSSGPMADAAGRAGPVTLEVTGTDYQPATLATVLRTAPTSEALPQQADGTPTLPSGSAARVPAGLSRLTGAGALDACLTALDGVVGARPVLVDYARFQGGAALVTVVPTSVADRPWLVVAGPECGTGTADVRYQRRAS
jgi:hypothetical protein